jgi:hypothetical protein
MDDPNVPTDATDQIEMQARLRGLRVLVLEDETIVLVMIEEMLDELGCTVVGPAATVADVLAGRGIPFAFVTGYSADVLTPPHDGRPILEKPFWGDALAKVLNRLVAPA